MKYLAALILMLLVAGCLGKTAPGEQYLRVLAPAAECSDDAQKGVLPVVGVRQFKALDALDRQGVMLADGKVMQASQRWYWEASPAKLVEQALVRSIGCTGGMLPAWPVRSTTNADLWISGMVRDFSVETRGMTVVIDVECQVWGASGGVLLESKAFRASVPLSALDGAAIADGAATAVTEISAKIGQWVKGNIPAAKSQKGRP